MEERRLFPRYPFEHDVELSNADGAVAAAQTSELSAVGVGMLVYLLVHVLLRSPELRALRRRR